MSLESLELSIILGSLVLWLLLLRLLLCEIMHHWLSILKLPWTLWLRVLLAWWIHLRILTIVILRRLAVSLRVLVVLVALHLSSLLLNSFLLSQQLSSSLLLCPRSILHFLSLEVLFSHSPLLVLVAPLFVHIVPVIVGVVSQQVSVLAVEEFLEVVVRLVGEVNGKGVIDAHQEQQEVEEIAWLELVRQLLQCCPVHSDEKKIEAAEDEVDEGAAEMESSVGSVNNP